MSPPISKKLVEDIKLQWLTMIDTIEDPLVLIDENYNIIRQNKAYLQTIQKSLKDIRFKDLIGQKCYETFAKRASPCKHCLVKSTNKKNPDTAWNSSQLIKDHTFAIRAHLMSPTAEHKFPRYVIHYRDITVEKKLEKSLSHSDKLAAIGKLAGGVAHEINSPLAAILAFTQIILTEIEKDSPHRNDLEQIQLATRKCKEIVENLLSFARHETKIVEKNQIHLIEEIKKTVSLAYGILQQKHIKIVWNIDETTDDIIVGNSGQIGQIFLNLITNAMQAMPQGGWIEFERHDEKDFICISIQDAGSGIKPEIIDKIFDPFFTTKTVGQGTGLGLSITYSLIKQHGGNISVSSLLNEGTTFTLRFPKI
ncbi:ATP-binding protein [Silvanigrella aquatica]|nr:ATP-binding protein [Silvanigrella aquatica]